MKIIMNIIFMIIATTMAIALTITTFTRTNTQETTLITGPPGPGGPSVVISPFPKRASRFLAETKNPRAAAAAGDNCKKDDEVCNIILDGKNSTCCGNKCMDLSEDKQNCGACKNKCKFTSSCCRGECVNLAYDKRNCGACGNKCMPGGYCIYGLCNYA